MTTGQPTTPDAEVLDPQTSPARLGEIVQQRPDLGAAVARHPQAYPALLDWLAAYGDPHARATVAAIRAAAAAPVAPVAFAPEPAAAWAAAPAAAAYPSPVAVADPAAPAPEQADVDVLGATRPRPRGRMVAGIVAGVVVLVLAAGGAFAYLTFFHGAGSPQGAVEKLVDGALSGDMVALGTSIAPSERALIQDMVDGLTEVAEAQLGDLDGMEDIYDVDAVLDTVDIDLSGMVYQTEELADGVSVVRIDGGVISADVDKWPFVDAVMEQVDAMVEASSEQMAELGLDDSMIDAELDTAREGVESWVDETFPWELDIADVIAEQRQYMDGDMADKSPLAFVTVDEGGWYVSPMLTVAELAAYSAFGTDERGSEVVAALDFATPEDAVAGTADAIEEFFATQDLETLAAVMPLPERRLMSIYGDLVMEGDMSGAPDVALDIADLDVEATGDRALAEILGFTLAVEPNDGYSDPTTITYSDGCFTMESDYTDEFCLADAMAFTAGFSVEDVTLTVLREGDGWLVSPIATLGDYMVRMTEMYAEMSQDGSLEELMYGF
ncbi:hypothetical protein [Demequina subtropica]|uniref:variant leucine-rich repeat-containing protein n=1 Tax=Demequina subtropica TaxID=1638989 RepID=UPI000781D9FC|nr:hypothetical protein [Demequina subtropica]